METLKQLTRKQQIEHIWEYYRWHIAGFIIAAVIIIQLSIAIFGPKEPKPIANVVVIGTYMHDEENIAYFENELQGIIDHEGEGKVELNLFPVDWAQSSEITMAMEQKLMLMIQAKEIDVLIIQKEKIDAYLTYGADDAFEQLDAINEFTQIVERNEKVKDKEGKVYGVYATNNIKLQKLGLSDDFIISIPATSQNKENARSIIQWLYE